MSTCITVTACTPPRVKMIEDIDQRRGGVNRREVIDRKIRAEVDAHEHDPNPYDVEGWSRIHYAAKWGLVDRINMLIEKV